MRTRPAKHRHAKRTLTIISPGNLSASRRETGGENLENHRNRSGIAAILKLAAPSEAASCDKGGISSAWPYRQNDGAAQIGCGVVR